MLESISPTRPALLVGHSMGGNIASLYAGTFPERVAAFANLEGLGPQGLPPGKAPERLREWIQDAAQPPRQRIYPTLEAIAERLGAANPRVPRDRLAKIAEAMSTAVAGGFEFSADPRHKWTHSYLTPLDQYEAFWRRIQARCLIVLAAETNLDRWVQHDGDFQKEVTRRLSHYPADTLVQTIPNCGHMLHLEAPEAVATALGAFFAAFA